MAYQEPKRIHLYGNLFRLNFFKPIQSLMKLAEVHGPIFRLKLAEDFIVVSSQELVAEVCDDTRFDKKIYSSLRDIRTFTGDGLFTALTEEKNWEKAHRVLMPAFGPASLRHMYASMIDIADQMLNKWQELGDDCRLDVTDHMTRLTLDTLALAAFDYRFNSFQTQTVHPVIEAMVKGMAEVSARGLRPAVLSRLMFKTRKKFENNAHILHEVADEVIADRKLRPAHASSKKDLLATMLESSDPRTGEKLDVVNIRYQLVTFLIAGHDTTSGLLSFALYEMVKNPKILAKARAEVDEMLGSEVPGIEKIQKLKYIDQILKEALRLWPTAPAFGRYPLEATQLGERFLVRPDQTILILLPSLHRDPKVWDNPECFDPDRMAKEAFLKLPPHAWKPFGTGARACIGRAFAMHEATLVLAMILQRFDLRMDDPNYKLTINEAMTLKPVGFYLRFQKRKG